MSRFRTHDRSDSQNSDLLGAFLEQEHRADQHPLGTYDSILVPTKLSFGLHTPPKHTGWLQRCLRCRTLKAYVDRITGVIGTYNTGRRQHEPLPLS